MLLWGGAERAALRDLIKEWRGVEKRRRSVCCSRLVSDGRVRAKDRVGRVKRMEKSFILMITEFRVRCDGI